MIGCIATFSKFLARSDKREHPFFFFLKNQVEFKWMEECESAFQDLKIFLVEPLVLSKLRDGEPLYIYLSVIERAIS